MNEEFVETKASTEMQDAYHDEGERLEQQEMMADMQPTQDQLEQMSEPGDGATPYPHNTPALISGFVSDSSVKVGNLRSPQIGRSDFTTAGLVSVSQISNIFGHPLLADFLNKQALVISDTSCARDGWLPELAVMQKKVSHRMTGSNNNQQKKSSGWGPWAKTEPVAAPLPTPPVAQ